MRLEDIEIHVGPQSFEFAPIKLLEAKCEATMAFAPAPTIEEMNDRLRAMAAKVGADAVVNVEYSSGVSLTSWKSMTGRGLAVRKISEDRLCPYCAEMVKRAAVRCKHCGAEIPVLPEPSNGEASASQTPSALASDPHMDTLRETNNPQIWLWCSSLALFFLLLLLFAMS